MLANILKPQPTSSSYFPQFVGFNRTRKWPSSTSHYITLYFSKPSSSKHFLIKYSTAWDNGSHDEGRKSLVSLVGIHHLITACLKNQKRLTRQFWGWKLPCNQKNLCNLHWNFTPTFRPSAPPQRSASINFVDNEDHSTQNTGNP